MANSTTCPVAPSVLWGVGETTGAGTGVGEGVTGVSAANAGATARKSAASIAVNLMSRPVRILHALLCGRRRAVQAQFASGAEAGIEPVELSQQRRPDEPVRRRLSGRPRSPIAAFLSITSGAVG